MKILFLSLSKIATLSEGGIYTDLLRQFTANGDDVFIVRPSERRDGRKTAVSECGREHILAVSTLNIMKTNVIEKGIGIILLETQFKRAIKKYWGDIVFDMIIYSTPPITFNDIISDVKRRCNTLSYLLLKDIFPQNAVDLGMMSKLNPLYLYFRSKEKKLYRLSDYIGTMSPANSDYILGHNTFIPAEKVEVCPNSIEIASHTKMYPDERRELRMKYGLPENKVVFVYGGNLGRPQGIDFLIECLESNKVNEQVYFLIIGNGTEYPLLASWFERNSPANARLIPHMPPAEYENLVQACDVGLIFLDRRFTIPNYPSRLLSYLRKSIPVLLSVDLHTDIGKIAQANGYGLWNESGDLEAFNRNLEKMVAMSAEERSAMGTRGYDFLSAEYDVRQAYKTITGHLNV